MFCTNCGKEIDNQTAFCPYCGCKNEPVEPAKPVNKTEAFIAQREAQKQQAAAPVVPPVVPQQPVAPQQPIAQQMPAGAPYAPQQQAYALNRQPAPQPKKKGMPAWAIVLIIIGVLAVVGTVTGLLIKNVLIKKVLPGVHDQIQSQIDSDIDDLIDEFDSMSPYSSTQEQTETDYDNVGKPDMDDFKWYNGVPQGFPKGSTQLGNAKDINGKWKAYYVIGDVKELCNIEIQAGDRAVTVTVEPYMINYDGNEWNEETGVGKYSYEGNYDTGVVTAFSDKFGSISLYAFYEKDGKQYGFGNTMLQSGESVEIALVRP